VPGIMAQTEHVKTVHEQYQVSENAKMIVDSEFCDVVFISGNSNEVEINIQMSVTTKKEEDAEKYFDRWKFNMEKNVSGNVVLNASLRSKKSSNNDNKTKCVVHISLPQHMSVDISTDFGSVQFDEHLGNVDLELSFGEFDANLLSGEKINLEIDFSKATIRNHIKQATIELSYSTLNLESIDNLKLNTSFSTINLEQVGQLQTESSYDKINIENAVNLIVDADFTNVKLDHLTDNIKGTFSYGSCEVENFGKQVKNVDIRADFTSVKIRNMNGVTFKTVDISSEFAGSKIDIANHLDFANTKTKKDYITKYQKTNPNATGEMLFIKTSYGSIRID
jgi:hypothetical protein